MKLVIIALSGLVLWICTNAAAQTPTQPATQPTTSPASMPGDAANYVKQINQVLPKGWLAMGKGNMVIVQRANSVRAEYRSPVGMGPDIRIWQPAITLEFGPRMPMKEYCRLAAKNEVADAAEMARHPNYSPVNNPISHRLPHRLPTHLDERVSVWISGGYLDKPLKFDSMEEAEECSRVYTLVKEQFRPYPQLYLLWGYAENGLRAGLDLEQPAMESGGKIKLLFRLHNEGNKPVRILHLASQAKYWGQMLPLQVVYDHKIMKYRGPVLEPLKPPSPSEYVELAPGETDSVEVMMDPANWGVEAPSKAGADFVFENTDEKVAPGRGWPVIRGLWTGRIRSHRIGLAPRPTTPATQPLRAASEEARQRAEGLKNSESIQLELIPNAVPGTKHLLLDSGSDKRKFAFPVEVARISPEQRLTIIDYLAAEGFLDNALAYDMANPQYKGQTMIVRVYWGKGFYDENLGWNLKMLNRLDELRKVLDGDAGTAMDKFLVQFVAQRRAWETASQPGIAPTTAPATQESPREVSILNFVELVDKDELQSGVFCRVPSYARALGSGDQLTPSAQWVYKHSIDQMKSPAPGMLMQAELSARLEGVYLNRGTLEVAEQVVKGDTITIRLRYISEDKDIARPGKMMGLGIAVDEQGRERDAKTIDLPGVTVSGKAPAKSVYLWGHMPADLPPGQYTVNLELDEYERKNGRLEFAPKETIRHFERLSCIYTVGDTKPATGPATQPAKPPQRPAEDIKVTLDQQIGKWHYRLFVQPASSKSREDIGELSFGGKPVTAESNGQFMWTPWGKLIFYARGAYKRGWMPYFIEHPAPQGKELASPDAVTSGLVRQRWEMLREAGESFRMSIVYRDGKGGGWFDLAPGHPVTEFPPGTKQWQVTLPKEQVPTVMDRLAAEGFLARALDPRLIRVGAQAPPLVIQFDNGKEPRLWLPLEPTSATVGQLQRIIEGIGDAKAPKQTADMLESLSEFVKRKAAATQPTAVPVPPLP